jgi:hypothetical protein
MCWLRRPLVQIFLGLVAIELLVCWLYRGPEPRSGDAPDDQFSAERAIGIHEALFPDQPHPGGSFLNQLVRDRLVETLQQLGLKVEVKQAVIESDAKVVLFNVLAEMPAPSEDKPDSESRATARPLVLASHYDSCRTGPGAADDGAAVAAMIETARALRHIGPLKRPIYFLFTDGEELGLLGAFQFVRSDPLSAKKPYVVAFDARGNRGPSLMYETHDGNSAAIGAWVSSLAKPRITGSLFAAVSRILPNSSDFRAFAPAGWQGFNFALIDGAHDYHQPSDNLANLDRRSVQHIGEHALSLAKVIASTDADLPTASGNSVYFDVLGLFVMQYPSSWSLPLNLFAFAGIGATNWRRIRAPGVPRAFVLVAVCAIAVVLTSTATGWFLSRLLRDVGVLPRDFVWYGGWIVLGLLLVSTSISLGLAKWSLRRCSAEGVWTALWLWWSLTGVSVATVAPEFSHLLLLPALLAAALSLTRFRAETRTIAVTLGSAVLLVPMLHLLSITLGPAGGVVLCPAFALYLLPLYPALALSIAGPEPNSSLSSTG